MCKPRICLANILFALLQFTGSFTLNVWAQNPANDSINSFRIYTGGVPYLIEFYPEHSENKIPKNVILLIGDGMGTTHINAAMVANGGQLYINQFRQIGFNTTWSASHFITDSGAGGTALATGKKTYNGAIGVGTDSALVRNIREIIAEQGKATGVVATSSVTHATPAAFVAHQVSRELHEAIAMDYLHSDADLFLGGGLHYFTNRLDQRNLIHELASAGYTIDTQTVATNPIPQFNPARTQKVVGLYGAEHLLPVDSGRRDFLPAATSAAIMVLNQNPKGFFLMVEGSQIDWGGHDRNTSYIVSEMLDFDRAVGEALRFAATDKNTLVIVTSDHETGGFSLINGDLSRGMVEGAFLSDDHTAVMVPVFAYGPGASLFAGFYDNTDIPKKIMKALTPIK
jgi:alkaline phosphatase